MAAAIQLSIENVRSGRGGPFAALVVKDKQVIATGTNLVTSTNDPTAHAEMLVLRAGAARLGAAHLAECDLYVTLEPCAMCAAAIAFAHLRRLYFAAYDPKGGAVEHGPRLFDQPTTHHRPEVYGGIEERRAGDLLRAFFRDRPKRLTRHVMTNVLVDLESPTSARAVSYALLYTGPISGAAVASEVTEMVGEFRDRLARVGGEWRFAERIGSVAMSIGARA